MILVKIWSKQIYVGKIFYFWSIDIFDEIFFGKIDFRSKNLLVQKDFGQKKMLSQKNKIFIKTYFGQKNLLLPEKSLGRDKGEMGCY